MRVSAAPASAQESVQDGYGGQGAVDHDPCAGKPDRPAQEARQRVQRELGGAVDLHRSLEGLAEPGVGSDESLQSGQVCLGQRAKTKVHWYVSWWTWAR